MVQKCFCTPDGTMYPTSQIKYVSSRFVCDLIISKKQITLILRHPVCKETIMQVCKFVYKYANQKYKSPNFVEKSTPEICPLNFQAISLILQ